MILMSLVREPWVNCHNEIRLYPVDVSDDVLAQLVDVVVTSIRIIQPNILVDADDFTGTLLFLPQLNFHLVHCQRLVQNPDHIVSDRQIYNFCPKIMQLRYGTSGKEIIIIVMRLNT